MPVGGTEPGQYGFWVFLFFLVVLAGAAVSIVRLRRRLEKQETGNRALIKERRATYAFLNQIGDQMSAHLDLEATLRIIVSFLVESTHAQAGAAFLMEPSRDALRARVLVGYFPPLHRTFDYALTKKKLLHQKMKSERIAVGEGIIGEVAASGEPLLVRNAREDDRIPQHQGLEIETLVAMPLMVQGRIEGVFALVNRGGGQPFTEEDVGILRALAEQASVTIQMVQMYDQMAEKQRIEQELRVAQEFQKLLLPKECPKIPGMEIAATNLPALEVGGDFYDFFWLDSDRLGIVIADVAGKGIPGALIMSMIRCAIRAECGHAPSLSAVLERVNETVLADTGENVFVTMIFAVLDVAKGTLTFARAGHEPLIAYSRQDGAMRLLAPDGIALGLVDGRLFSSLVEQELPLRDGDMAVLYTDGVVEAMSKQGNEYGQDRLLEMLRTHAPLPAEDLVHALVTDVRHFAQGGQQSDDITIVVLKFNSLAAAAQMNSPTREMRGNS